MLNEVNHELVLTWKTRFTETMQGRLYWTRQSVKAFSSKPWSDAQHEIMAAWSEALKLMDGYISVMVDGDPRLEPRGTLVRNVPGGHSTLLFHDRTESYVEVLKDCSVPLGMLVRKRSGKLVKRQLSKGTAT